MEKVSEPERQAFVKFARHTAVATDRLCGALIKLTQSLEEAKIIDPERPSKLERDKKLTKTYKDFDIPAEEVASLMEKLVNNPDAEKIISSLYRDYKPKRQTRSAQKADGAKDKAEQE
ncbi:hypothetical protein TVAG_230780 [Trichomonas vaginalis G3]|uniref:Uncharacterized protein n=1 Tax=Trichomonas vaginalis (strain ATCC PRA-98 / G3) TaxID=412133 RepID=A2EE06_TRIV3|nr:hypothetical protein TVAGG3_0890020 [Trichomonas vaginalis G3]EAY09118.1 hypothetical protein TVAG_230780 [Trichomonas vaginalis G3]KAI5502650.1 hypothetical protein TVAGG3_0890020 [Trichomonas vaginalis G3]|eukprot:XP_001321341.1 hypothetical protein [Trichomonas vaginalis G3]